MNNHIEACGSSAESDPEFERLLEQVNRVVAQSSDSTGFDARGWLTGWIGRPCAALGGAKPADCMITAEGMQVVFRLISQMQSSAYV